MDSNIVVGQYCLAHNLPIDFISENGPLCIECIR